MCRASYGYKHTNWTTKWKFREKEKYELKTTKSELKLLFDDLVLVLRSEITKRNLWHALNGEIVWMTWVVNTRAQLNRIKLLTYGFVGIMLCECTHYSLTHWSYVILYEKINICNHILKRNNLAVIKNFKFRVILSLQFPFVFLFLLIDINCLFVWICNLWC